MKYPVPDMIHSKGAGWENLYIQILRAKYHFFFPPVDVCENAMDSPNIWLLGFFLSAEVPVLSVVYFKEYLLLSVIFSEAFLFQAFL